MTEENALWQAIGAAPEDQLPRLVAADWYDERAGMMRCHPCSGGGGWYADGGSNVRVKCDTCGGTGRVSNGHAETAAAIRATAEKVPLQDLPDGSFTWFRKWGWKEIYGIHPESDLPPDLYAKLTGYDVMGTCRSYPTATDAIRDLCRAYVASRSKQEVPT